MWCGEQCVRASLSCFPFIVPQTTHYRVYASKHGNMLIMDLLCAYEPSGCMCYTHRSVWMFQAVLMDASERFCRTPQSYPFHNTNAILWFVSYFSDRRCCSFACGRWGTGIRCCPDQERNTVRPSLSLPKRRTPAKCVCEGMSLWCGVPARSVHLSFQLLRWPWPSLKNQP